MLLIAWPDTALPSGAWHNHVHKYPMQMLVDWHDFAHSATIPWPCAHNDWQGGVRQLESWLQSHVGPRLTHWAWSDSGRSEYIGVAFRWDQHRLLFVLTWH